MNISSYTLTDSGYQKLIIELEVIPGLPLFHFVGHRPPLLKGFDKKLKAAIKMQGYKWPRGKQIVCNVRPQFVKISDSKLELAIAIAFLLKTKQIKLSTDSGALVACGELSLRGEVFKISDEPFFPNCKDLLVGADSKLPLNEYYTVANLARLDSPVFQEGPLACHGFSGRQYDIEKIRLLEACFRPGLPLLQLGKYNDSINSDIHLAEELVKNSSPQATKIILTKDMKPKQHLNSYGQSWNFNQSGLIIWKDPLDMPRNHREYVMDWYAETFIENSIENTVSPLLLGFQNFCRCKRKKMISSRPCRYSNYRCQGQVKAILQNELSIFKAIEILEPQHTNTKKDYVTLIGFLERVAEYETLLPSKSVLATAQNPELILAASLARQIGQEKPSTYHIEKALEYTRHPRVKLNSTLA